MSCAALILNELQEERESVSVFSVVFCGLPVETSFFCVVNQSDKFCTAEVEKSFFTLIYYIFDILGLKVTQKMPPQK